MQREFLDYYRDNLQYLRELSQEFAAEFPKVAQRLILDEVSCKDPFVERLLEGTAFLCARVEKRLDDGYPRLLEQLLSMCAPFMLLPRPALGLARPAEARLAAMPAGSLQAAAGMRWKGRSELSKSELSFSLVCDSTLHALRIQDCTYLPACQEFAHYAGHSALRLQLSALGRCSLNEIDLSALDLCLNLSDADASALSELLIENLQGALVRLPGGQVQELKLQADFTLLERGSPLLAQFVRAMPGQAALWLWLSYPQLFKFVTLRGLHQASFDPGCTQAELFLFFEHCENPVAGQLSGDSLQLNVLPLINLFSRRISRQELSLTYEYHLSAERSAPLDFEICALRELELIDAYNQVQLTLLPFFASGLGSGSGGMNGTGSGENFFAEHKRLRRSSGGSTRLRSSYLKSETYAALSGPDFAALAGKKLEIGGLAWCCNADLPVFCSRGAALEAVSEPKLGALTLLQPFSTPLPAQILSGREDDYQALAGILLQAAPFLTGSSEECCAMLRRLTQSFSPRPADESAQIARSVLKLESREQTFRRTEHGCVYFERGCALDLTISERALAGTGFYVFARLISELVFSLVPLNLPLNITLYSPERGRICTWTSLKSS
ncbi:MAG: type VI secretion system baseplate subunit TssF [Proteobacteria bacterium]|uniref:Type VI secretion system baseplate subunit TssF n=1 Tax=Candidatus Avisuccinivibrio stercorigallinarum TaxID=2840704 RepID=A0A9D9GT29_9GAMM|nr:type VI secretion system baseplate subunit TssF [Candidatus Avisuccinivibrio stercorigallinarum]